MRRGKNCWLLLLNLCLVTAVLAVDSPLRLPSTRGAPPMDPPALAGEVTGSFVKNQGPNQQFRGVWIATVNYLDWPSQRSTLIPDPVARIAQQQAELRRILDKVVEMGMNTVIFQVKPCADALYHSAFLPWSTYLTGTLGQDPGFDPLAYALEQAHARGVQLHAWINPYRVSMNLDADTEKALQATPLSVYRDHPEWVKTAYQRYVLDPGLPAVRTWIEQIVEEIVSQYAIDGIQFDDYFYYESPHSTLDDDQTYSRYGADFTCKADWRRHNTYTLIKAVSKKIKAIKPQVKFGISPSGIWRNKKEDPQGSDTDASHPHYDTAYADTRQWVQEALIDYIVPQIYWSHSLEMARYSVVATWWADLVKSTQTQLYIGMGLYKVGQEFRYQLAGKAIIDREWSTASGVPEIEKQLDLNETTPGIQGSVLFRALTLWDPQTQPAVDTIKMRWTGAAGHSDTPRTRLQGSGQ